MVAGTVRSATAVLATLGAVMFAVALLAVSEPASSSAGSVAIGAVLAVVVPVGICLALIRRTREAFGGITGDVLGAGVELGATAALLTLALAG